MLDNVIEFPRPEDNDIYDEDGNPLVWIDWDDDDCVYDEDGYPI